MSTQDEAVTWDDMDWGAIPSEAAVDLPTSPNMGAEVSPTVPVPEISPPPPAMENVLPAQAPKDEVPPKPVPQENPRIETRPTPVARQAGEGNAIVHVPETIATLTLVGADGGETVVTFDRDFTVGRRSDNDLVIRDRQVSGHHSRLVAQRDGSFEIEDLNSSGGTLVNGEEVERRILANGDRIEFSGVVALFHYIAGRQIAEANEFDETLPFRKAKPTQLSPKTAPPKKIGMFTIVLADQGKILIPVSNGEVTIGRGEENDLVIADGHVSGNHAKIVPNGEGEYEVVDLDSTCGTFVNGLPIVSAPLYTGDRITFGLVEGVFEIVNA